MKRSNLDTIVRGELLNHQLTLHWYLQVLKYSSDCLREMAFDDLQVINSVELTLTSYKAVTIPCNAVDILFVGPKNGQYLKPMAKTQGFNRMYNYDSSGNPLPWPSAGDSANVLADFGIPQLAFYINSYNNRGENIGGLYGYRSEGSPYIYQVFEERNEIQLDVDYGFPTVVVQYISDGRSTDAATSVDTYSEDCIGKYISWQMAENNRAVPSGEKDRLYRLYVRAREIFRARKNDMTLVDLVNLFHKSYTATIKT